MGAFGHIINLIITIFFWPWIIVWVGCAVSAGNSRKRQERKLQERQLAVLEEMARVGKWKNWNDK